MAQAVTLHSTWRDEKSVVRWRTEGEHHVVQEKGRFEIFRDYHLRVDPSDGWPNTTSTPASTIPENWRCWWRGRTPAADTWSPKKLDGIETLRHRRVRVVRDYCRFDRREAPQY